MPSSVRRPLMSEAKQDNLYRTNGYRILTNATFFTLLHDEDRFRMRNSQRSSIFIWRFIHIIPSGLFANIVAPSWGCKTYSWTNELHEMSTGPLHGGL